MGCHRKLAVAVGFVVALAGAGAGTARAQAIEPLGDLPDGNVRVSLYCADYWATPRDGLAVAVDGIPAATTGTNGTTVVGYGKHGIYEAWAPTDVGFSVAPGIHHVEVAAPGCATEVHDVQVGATRPTYMTGRMAITDEALRGSTGAPNGIGFAIGAASAPLASRTGVTAPGTAATAFDSAPTNLRGVWLSTSYEHRHLALALDSTALFGSTTGTMREVGAPAPAALSAGEMQYSETDIAMRTALRVGPRFALGQMAIAGGTGVGVDVHTRMATAGPGSDPFAVPPSGADATWYLPAWVALTEKPWCDVGFQLVAEYDVHPGDGAQNGAAVSAGLLWQPSRACSEPARVRVHY